ncbi:SUMF1/EgtB/PvdO family nonheme iron enzyme [Candidatus Villigracilis affinis]|uniref:formylglycine-generating enzyme family protein n=1 Tax=Candidatus Villigracilis affinis TaxID=3140682 RepID=UPI002A227DCC|nr:SUMF1/EgtB/PvdO family nonheme iron enzyme [Anaerolineales bacterium]
MGISWDYAISYCEWFNETNVDNLPKEYELRLPTEAEWEKAASGTDGKIYPWGNSDDESGKKHNRNKNSSLGEKKYKVDSMPVGSYSPQGDSPFGCADMVGNGFEWTHSIYKPYPYKIDDGRESEERQGVRVLRSSSFLTYGGRCAHRERSETYDSQVSSIRLEYFQSQLVNIFKFNQTAPNKACT